MPMPSKKRPYKCMLPGCDVICMRSPYQLKKSHGFVFCCRDHGAKFNRGKITVRPGRPRGVRIDRPCSCGCGNIISKTPGGWRKSDKQNGSAIAYFSIQCHNRLLNVPGRHFDNPYSPPEKLESRVCTQCGDLVTRRPCEFKSEMAFCDHVCANVFHNQRLSEQKTIEKICAYEGCQLPEKKFYVRKCESFRMFCGRSCMWRHFASRDSEFVDSPIELMMQKALTEAGVKFSTQEPLLSGRTCPDIFIKACNLCIYCDGMAWHSLPGRVAADLRINEALRLAGYIVLRFWGREIKRDASACVAQIKAAMEPSPTTK